MQDSFDTYFIHRLSNGIRIVFKPVASNITHLGLFINVGSRDEMDNEHGLAHLIEHVIFKGTRKRKLHQILSCLENVGGEVNAFTSKEETCIQAAFMRGYLSRALDLISDILLNSVFPINEIEKEKKVIIDEINYVKDNPSDYIFDEFDSLLFPNSRLGRNILGIPEKINNYNRDHIIDFINRNYVPENIVISVVGNYTTSKLFSEIERYFNHYPIRNKCNNREKPEIAKPFKIESKKNILQSHCVLGVSGYCYYNNKRYALHLLNNIIGGPTMNSRLSMILREKYGYSYNVESSYVSYCDTGIFSVYFSSDASNISKCIELVSRQFDELKNNHLSSIKLNRAKKQLIGQLCINAENNENIMLTIGKSVLTYDRVEPLSEVIRKVEQISANEILEVANEILDYNKMSVLIYRNK